MSPKKRNRKPQLSVWQHRKLIKLKSTFHVLESKNSSEKNLSNNIIKNTYSYQEGLLLYIGFFLFSIIIAVAYLATVDILMNFMRLTVEVQLEISYLVSKKIAQMELDAYNAWYINEEKPRLIKILIGEIQEILPRMRMTWQWADAVGFVLDWGIYFVEIVIGTFPSFEKYDTNTSAGIIFAIKTMSKFFYNYSNQMCVLESKIWQNLDQIAFLDFEAYVSCVAEVFPDIHREIENARYSSYFYEFAEIIKELKEFEELQNQIKELSPIDQLVEDTAKKLTEDPEFLKDYVAYREKLLFFKDKYGLIHIR